MSFTLDRKIKVLLAVPDPCSALYERQQTAKEEADYKQASQMASAYFYLIESLGYEPVGLPHAGTTTVDWVSVKTKNCDIAICEMHIPGSDVDGFEIGCEIHKQFPNLPLILIDEQLPQLTRHIYSTFGAALQRGKFSPQELDDAIRDLTYREKR